MRTQSELGYYSDRHNPVDLARIPDPESAWEFFAARTAWDSTLAPPAVGLSGNRAERPRQEERTRPQS